MKKFSSFNENFTENYVINLLKFYGIKDIENYLNPDFNMLQSPLNLDNIHEGYELLKSKCENKNKSLLGLIILNCCIIIILICNFSDLVN